MGVEPFRGYIAGIMELITVIVLVIPGKAWLGAIFGIVTMSGVIPVDIYRKALRPQ